MMADHEEGSGVFKINKAYAKAYDARKRKEELQKLKDKYGDIGVDEDVSSSSSSESDSDAEALTPQIEHDWLKTLEAVRNRDPKIYDPNIKFYHEDDPKGNDAKKSAKKYKPLFLRDMDRKLIVERGGKYDDESPSEDDAAETERPTTYDEEIQQVRNEFRFKMSDEETSEDDDIMVKKSNSKSQEKAEIEDQRKWEKNRARRTEKQCGIDVTSLPSFWKDANLNEGEKYLRNYFTEKKYLEKDDKPPMYDDEVGDELEEEEQQLEKEELFERKYNYRFEEPDTEFIKSYPHKIDDTARRTETTRAKKRRERKEKKKLEKDKRAEEIKRLKNIKKLELQEMLSLANRTQGGAGTPFTEDEIDGEFDPEKYDEIMRKKFDDDYYDDDVDDDTKPVFDDYDDDGDEMIDWDNWQGPAQDTGGPSQNGDDAYEPHCEDQDFNMDADYDPSQHVKREKKNKKDKLKKRSAEAVAPDVGPDGVKKKKKSKFLQALERKKPVFDPMEKTFEEYIDEYYHLDYEDIIGDQPVRFSYRKVVPNDYGLQVDEVLKARDQELNAWVSLKKMSQYRTKEDEMYDVEVFRRKGRNIKTKLNVLSSLRNEEKDEAPSTAKLAGKTAKPSATVSAAPSVTQSDDRRAKKRKRDESNETSEKPASKKRKNEKKHLVKLAVQTMNDTANKNITDNTKIGTTDAPSSLDCSISESRKKVADNSATAAAVVASDGSVTKKAKRKKSKSGKNRNKVPKLSDARIEAYGFNPKKFKYEYMKKLHAQKTGNK